MLKNDKNSDENPSSIRTHKIRAGDSKMCFKWKTLKIIYFLFVYTYKIKLKNSNFSN